MIVDRFEPVNLSELIPELRLEMEPSLQALDRLLDDDEIFLRIKADLSKRHPNSESLGRRSTPVEVILRMLMVRRLYPDPVFCTRCYESVSTDSSSSGLPLASS